MTHRLQVASEVVGFVALVAAAALVAVPLGLAVLGVGLLAAGNLPRRGDG